MTSQAPTSYPTLPEQTHPPSSQPTSQPTLHDDSVWLDTSQVMLTNMNELLTCTDTTDNNCQSVINTIHRHYNSWGNNNIYGVSTYSNNSNTNTNTNVEISSSSLFYRIHTSSSSHPVYRGTCSDWKNYYNYQSTLGMS